MGKKVPREERLKKTPRLIGQGIRPKYLADFFGVDRRTIKNDLDFLRETRKIPDTRKKPISKERINWLIENASAILSNKADRWKPKRPRRAFGGSKGLGNKMHLITTALKQDPTKSNAKIAKETGSKNLESLVGEIRQILVEHGEIKEVSKGQILRVALRKPERKTNWFTKEKRKKILDANAGKVAKAVQSVYRKRRDVFEAAGVLPEDLAEEILGDLDWKLQIFDPKKMQGPERTKLDRMLNYQIKMLLTDKVTRTFTKYNAKQRGRDTIVRAAESRQASTATTAGKPLTLAELEELIQKSGLSSIEKAVFLGLQAGFTELEIGKLLDRTGPRISHFRTRIFKKIEGLRLR